MEFDEVERELVVISGRLHHMVDDFAALGRALRREREFATTGGTRGRKPRTNKTNEVGEVQPPLPFPYPRRSSEMREREVPEDKKTAPGKHPE